MNLLNVESTKKCLIAECWIPTDDVPRVREALNRGNVIFHFLIISLILTFLNHFKFNCMNFSLINLF